MKLREEDLVPGRRFVHPDTKLEYEDFHAWFCGCDPLPHWRNARIKELHAGHGKEGDWQESEFGSFEQFLSKRFDYFRRCYSRDGDLFAASYAIEHGAYDAVDNL